MVSTREIVTHQCVGSMGNSPGASALDTSITGSSREDAVQQYYGHGIFQSRGHQKSGGLGGSESHPVMGRSSCPRFIRSAHSRSGKCFQTDFLSCQELAPVEWSLTLKNVKALCQCSGT